MSGITPSFVVSAAPTMAIWLSTLLMTRLPRRAANSGSVTSLVELLERDLAAGMSSTSASGVCSTPTMLVIMRGPSSSWTTAMA